MEKKICSVCNQVKLISDYYVQTYKKKDGSSVRTTYGKCKPCYNKVCKERVKKKCEDEPEYRIKLNKLTNKWKKKYPEKNREYVKEYWKKLRIENPEKYKNLKREQQRKQRKTEAYKEKKRRFRKRQAEELRDHYVRRYLGGSQFNDLIPLKREIIKVRRLCKEILKT